MGILAVRKEHERSLVVYLLILPGLFFAFVIIGFLIANLIGPPD